MGKRGKRRRWQKRDAAEELHGETNLGEKDKEQSPNSKKMRPLSFTAQRVHVECKGWKKASDAPVCPPLLTITDAETDKTETSTLSDVERQYSRIWNYLGRNRKAGKQLTNKPDETYTGWSPSLIQGQLWSLLSVGSSKKEQPYNTIAIAPTGSGKTLAYAIPTVLHRIQSTNTTTTLVLVPTRELVVQVSKVYKQVHKAVQHALLDKLEDGNPNLGVRVLCIFGGVDRSDQLRQLSDAGNEKSSIVIVATPGRLLDLLQDEQNKIQVSADWIVLDEADQLARPGSLGPQVDEIIEATKNTSESHFVLVSATYPKKVHSYFVTWVGEQHILVRIDALEQGERACKAEVSSMEMIVETTAEDAKDTRNQQDQEVPSRSTSTRIPSNIEQILHVCADHKKPKKLIHTLRSIRNLEEGQRNPSLGIVFFAKIEKVKYTAKLLQREGVSCTEIHSQLPTLVRQENLKRFSAGQSSLLLATDVAARGIDIPSVKFVIQYDFPGNLVQYVHRCGRAGRNGDNAKVYSFFTRNLKALAGDVVQLLEANNAWVDPNLRCLIQGGRGLSTRKQQDASSGVSSKNQGVNRSQSNSSVADRCLGGSRSEDDNDDEDFAELSANRIVLKRASHVSDVSSSDKSDAES